jgi:hypothetical protein
MITYKIFRDNRDITKPEDFKNTGYDRESMRQCWAFLDQTSRSFSMVIKELDGELARVVSCCDARSCSSYVVMTDTSRCACSTSFCAHSTRSRTT